MSRFALIPARLQSFVRLAKFIHVKDAAKLAMLVFAPTETTQVFVRRWTLPVTIRPGTSDLAVFHKILLDQEYAPPDRLNPLAILDAGAYIGLSSLYFHFCFPDATIIALEPDPENFRLLKSNTERIPKIIAINSALWSSSTPQKFTVESMAPWASRVSERPASEVKLVKCMTIDDADKLSECRIDFIKLDIEGGEAEVFKDVPSNLLARLKAIVIEFHERFFPGSSEPFLKAVNAIKHRRFEQGENSWFIFDHSMSSNPPH